MSDRTRNILSFPDRETIEVQAATWIARQSERELSAEDSAAFQKWLGTSEVHQAAYERLRLLWDEAAVLQELPDIADAVGVERTANGWARRHRGALAASVAAVCCALLLLLGQPFPGTDRGAKDYVSAVGEQRTIRLPDGSVVLLNTDTAISFQIIDNVRMLRLLNGEAFFEVAHDPASKFLVHTPAGSVEAIGTAFATRLLDRDSLEVIVAEGRVAVRPGAPSPIDAAKDEAANGEAALDEADEADEAPAAELSAGTSALFTPERRVVEPTTTIEIDRKLAWRDGVLVFAGEPLRTVVDDVSRYTNIDIAISDKALEAVPIGGYFRVGETDALFEALELSFGVKVQHLAKGRVLLTRADEKNIQPEY